MKKFIIQTLAEFCIIILYTKFAVIDLSINYGNFIGFIAFPILIPISAWVYDRDL